MGKFKHYIENKESEASTPEAKEAMREIQIVMSHAIDKTEKVNGFGINNIGFEIISQEKGDAGVQINLEAKGEAVAKNEQHISRMLQKLVNQTREDLWKKNIFFEMMYHKIETSETKTEAEEDEINIGLKKTLYFTVICAACVFN